MLTYPWKCTVLHCNHLGNTLKPLVLMTRHFDYCLSASEGDNQSVGSSAPVVSRCFPDGYNVKLYISRGKLAWWLLAFLHSVISACLHLTSGKQKLHHWYSMLTSASGGSSVLVVSSWLWPGNRTFWEVDSMVVTWWIVAFWPVNGAPKWSECQLSEGRLQPAYLKRISAERS